MYGRRDPNPIDNKSPDTIVPGLCTDQQEYFQHLESFLRLIEPIIQDLKVKGFIK
jgi:hypothetical protein